MEMSYIITEENLIGNLAGAILELKKVKEGKIPTVNSTFLTKLITFIEGANEDDYSNLLYDKHFIVSEKTLENLHQEFKYLNISSKVNFENLKAMISSLDKDKGIIMSIMEELRQITTMILQIKSQTY